MYFHVFTMVCLSESIKCHRSQSAILRKWSYKEPTSLRRLLEIDSTWSKFILRMTHVKKRQVRLKIRTTRCLSSFTLEQRSNGIVYGIVYLMTKIPEPPASRFRDNRGIAMNPLFPLDTNGDTRASYTWYYLAVERERAARFGIPFRWHSGRSHPAKVKRRCLNCSTAAPGTGRYIHAMLIDFSSTFADPSRERRFLAIAIRLYVSVLLSSRSSLQLITPINAANVRRTRSVPRKTERERSFIAIALIVRPDMRTSPMKVSRMGGFHSRIDSRACIPLSRIASVIKIAGKTYSFYRTVLLERWSWSEISRRSRFPRLIYYWNRCLVIDDRRRRFPILIAS